MIKSYYLALILIVHSKMSRYINVSLIYAFMLVLACNNNSVPLDIDKVQEESVGIQIEQMQLVNTTMQEYSLSKLLTMHEKMLVLHFTEASCLPCIALYTEMLDVLSNDHECVHCCVIAAFDHLRDLFILERELGVEVTCYKSNEVIKTPMGEEYGFEHPIVFVLNDDMTIDYPRIGFPEDTLATAHYGSILESLCK